MEVFINIIIVLVFLGMVFFLVLLHACSYGRSIERSISKTDLENLPCYDYVAKENRSNSLECAICLENFTIGDKCRLLPICKHSFHAKCVDKWLLKNSLCPICRSRVCILCANKVVLGNNGRESSSRNVGIELRENNPTLEVESQEQ
jgi:hypothetical protein